MYTYDYSVIIAAAVVTYGCHIVTNRQNGVATITAL